MQTLEVGKILACSGRKKVSGALWGHVERGRGLRLRCVSGPVASVRRYRQGKVLGMKSYSVGKPLEHFMEKEKKKCYE